jgi:hypothetical protein
VGKIGHKTNEYSHNHGKAAYRQLILKPGHYYLVLDSLGEGRRRKLQKMPFQILNQGLYYPVVEGLVIHILGSPTGRCQAIHGPAGVYGIQLMNGADTLLIGRLGNYIVLYNDKQNQKK